MKKLTLTLAGLSMLGAFSIDTYFPSFPAIADHFNVTMADMQKTLSDYLGAIAFMSLFHGAMSDSFGRRNYMLVCIGLYTVGCIGSLLSPSFEWMLTFRVIQGLTAGAGFIMTQAIARDLFKGHEAQQMMAKIMMVFSLAPAIAPILGGYLHVWLGWHGPFLFLSFLGAFIWLMVYLNLPETLPKEERVEFHPVVLIENYLKIARHLQFLLLTVSSALGTAGIALYVTSAPDFVFNILHLKETQFGWMFIPIVSGLLLGSFLSHRLAGKWKIDKIIMIAYVIMGTAASINLAYNLIYTPSIPWAVLPLGIYVIGSAMASPTLGIKAIDLFPHNRGLASSINSFMTMAAFTIVSALVAPHIMSSGLRLAGVMATMVVLNSICYFLAEKRKAKI